jgi:Protein of unknown function (DUF3179)
MFSRRVFTVVATILGGFGLVSWLILGTLGPSGPRRRAAPSLAQPSEAGNPALAARGPRGPFPPLVDVPIASAADASAEVLDDDHIVGVEIDGEARAYPISMLSRPDRHVLNDTLGGRPIAVTWGGLCQSPIVYDRRVDGRTLVFFVPGGVFGQNMAL